MKKLIALILAACLLLQCSFVLAEEIDEEGAFRGGSEETIVETQEEELAEEEEASSAYRAKPVEKKEEKAADSKTTAKKEESAKVETKAMKAVPETDETVDIDDYETPLYSAAGFETCMISAAVAHSALTK